MSQLDDRLLDHILETLKEVVGAVSDLYQKQGATEGEITRLTERLSAIQVQIDRYKEEIEKELLERREETQKLKDGDVDRRIDKGKYELIFKVVGAVALLVIGAAIGSLL